MNSSFQKYIVLEIENCGNFRIILYVKDIFLNIFKKYTNPIIFCTVWFIITYYMFLFRPSLPFPRLSLTLTNPLSLPFEQQTSRFKSQIREEIQRTTWLYQHLFVPISSNPSPPYHPPTISAVPFPLPPTTPPSSPSRPASPLSATDASHPRATSKPLPKRCSDSSAIWRWCAGWRLLPTPSINPSWSAVSATSTMDRKRWQLAWRPQLPEGIASSPPIATTASTSAAAEPYLSASPNSWAASLGVPRGKVAPCISTRRKTVSMAATVSSELKFILVASWPLRRSTPRTRLWRSPCTVMEQRTRGSCSRRLIWRRFGICRRFWFARTITVRNEGFYIIGIGRLCEFKFIWTFMGRWNGYGRVESSQESSILQAWGLCAWVEGNFYMPLIGLSGLWIAIDF